MATTKTASKTRANTKAGKPTERLDLDENSILLIVEFSRAGNRRIVKGAELVNSETDFSPEVLRASKTIFESEFLDFMRKQDSVEKFWLGKVSLPTLAFRGGAYRIPITLVERIEQRLSDYATTRQGYVRDFGEEYAAAIEKQKPLLGSLYRETDYPSKREVMGQCTFNWRWVAMAPPDKLAAISPKLLEQERIKQAERLRDEVSLVRDALRDEFSKLIDHAADRLKANENGKRPVFRDSLVGNINEFIENFGDRNLVGDAELARLVDMAKNVMQGVKPEELRNDEEMRDRIATAFEEVKTSLSSIDAIREADERAFSFDDV